MPITEFVIVGAIGILVGMGVILISQRNILPKKKYGYKKPSNFDYYSKIDKDVLNCNQPAKLEDIDR